MISGFVDSFPQLNQHKVLFTGLLCVAEFFVGLPLVTRVSSLERNNVHNRCVHV